jgi:hypothetical protein
MRRAMSSRFIERPLIFAFALHGELVGTRAGLEWRTRAQIVQVVLDAPERFVLVACGGFEAG